MVLLRISIALACVLAPTSVMAQVEYNWRTADRKETGKLRAGEVISVVVVDLNPICYSTRVDVSLVKANEDLSDVVAGLRRGTGESTQRPGDPIPPPPQTVQPEDSPITRSSEDEVRYLAAVHDAAREYIDVFRNKSRCAAPRGWSARELIDHALTDIPGQIDVIEGADLQQLSTQLQQLQLTGTPGSRRDTLVAKVAEMRSDRSDLIRDLRTILRDLPTLRADTEVTVQRHASADVERLLVQIQSTPTVGSSSRLFYLEHLATTNGFDAYEEWSFVKQYKALRRVQEDTQFPDAALDPAFHLTPDQVARAKALKKRAPEWRRPHAEAVAKALRMHFLYRYGYELASGHVHPMANDGVRDFYHITGLAPAPAFPNEIIVLSNTLLVSTMIIQSAMNASSLLWRRVVYDFVDAVREYLGDGGDTHTILFVKLGRALETGFQMAEAKPAD